MTNEPEHQPTSSSRPGGADPRMDEMAAERTTDSQAEPEQIDSNRPSSSEPRMDEMATQPNTDDRQGRPEQLDGYRVRFAEVQAQFIDDPRAAVQGARSLVQEAVDHMMESIQSDLGDQGDTERMRLAMQRYREVIDRIGSTT